MAGVDEGGADALHERGEQRRERLRDAPRTGALPPQSESELDRLARRSDVEVEPAEGGPQPHEGAGPGAGEGATTLVEAADPESPEEQTRHPTLRGS